MRRPSLVIALIAALHGAAGVALAAAAAHAEGGALLSTASQMLMVHAAAGLALVSLTRAGAPAPRWLAGASFALQAGVTLFSADLVARVYGWGRLFPFAAPMGGSVTILAWVALAIWAAAALIRPNVDGGE